MELYKCFGRVRDGICSPLPPSEILAWTKLYNVKIKPVEVAILHKMDLVFCDEINEELQAYRERSLDKIPKA